MQSELTLQKAAEQQKIDQELSGRRLKKETFDETPEGDTQAAMKVIIGIVIAGLLAIILGNIFKKKRYRISAPSPAATTFSGTNPVPEICFCRHRKTASLDKYEEIISLSGIFICSLIQLLQLQGVEKNK